MTMTKAALKTLRESLGLTPPVIADLAGVHFNILWRMESPTHTAKVSEAAERAIRELAATFDVAADRIAATIRKGGHLERPADRASFDELVPELIGWPDRSIGLFMAEVIRRTNATISYPKE